MFEKNKNYWKSFLFTLYLFFSITISYFFIIKKFLIASSLMGLLLLIAIFLCKDLFKKIKALSFLKFFFWLTIIAAIIGPAFWNISLGSYHLTPLRIILPFILFLIFLQILINKGKFNFSFKKIKFYLLFLILWLSYAILSLVWAQSKIDALWQIFFLFTGILLIFLVITFLKNLKEFKSFCLLWVLFIAILLGIGCWEHFTGNHLTNSAFFQKTIPRFKYIPTAIFHNPNDFATFLALSVPFLFSIIRYTKTKTIKVVSIILLSTSSYFILITGSRANLLALILIMFVLFFFLYNFNKKIKISLIIILLFFIFLLLFPNFFYNIKTQINTQLFSLTSSYQWSEGSIINRINLIKNANCYLIHSFGFGVGAGNIENHINQYSHYWLRSGLLNLHNWWIEILANYGILIFFGYLLFYLSLIKNLWKIWHQKIKTKEKIICETLLLFLIGFSIASISSSSIFSFNSQWLLFGFSLAFLNYYRIKYPTIKNKGL